MSTEDVSFWFLCGHVLSPRKSIGGVFFFWTRYVGYSLSKYGQRRFEARYWVHMHGKKKPTCVY